MSPVSDIPVPQKYCLSGIFQDGWCRTNTYLLHFFIFAWTKESQQFYVQIKTIQCSGCLGVTLLYIIFFSAIWRVYKVPDVGTSLHFAVPYHIFSIFFLIFIFIHFFPYHISLCDLTITKIQLRVNIMPSENILQSSFSENSKRGCWRKYWL